MRKRYSILFVLFWAPVLALAGSFSGLPAGARAQAYSCNSPVKIMALGDSVTKGSGPADYSGGYRQPLYLSLSAAGRDVDFVGSQNSEAADPPYDADHEGHAGFTSDRIANKVYDWLQNSSPDIILLHIGTNDVSLGLTSAGGVERTLDEIDRYEQDSGRQVQVVLSARIILSLDNTAATIEFNDNLQAMALARQETDHLTLVFHQDELKYPEDMADNLHPNKSGYIKMAAVWEKALLDMLPKCFSPLKVDIQTQTPQARAGSEADFRIRVKNTGKTYLYHPSLSDPLAPGCDQELPDLDIGAVETYTCALPDVQDDLTNRVTVTASVWEDIGLQVQGKAKSAVDVIHPAMSLAVTANPPEVRQGEAVRLALRVTNTGDSSLTELLPENDLSGCQLAGPQVDNGSGTSEPGVLEAGESWTYRCSLAAGSGDISGQMWVSAVDPSGQQLEASASVWVQVVEPGTQILLKNWLPSILGH